MILNLIFSMELFEKIVADINANPYEFLFWTALFYAGYHFSKKVYCPGDREGKTNDPGPR